MQSGEWVVMRRVVGAVALVLVLVVVFAGNVAGDETKHRHHHDKYSHKVGEETVVWANKVGPYRNPQETYGYYYLPLCKPEKRIGRPEGLGEQLLGYELVKSSILIPFAVDVNERSECNEELTQSAANRLKKAVMHQYWYQFYYDDLPVWGMVGESGLDANTGKLVPLVFTHKHFIISYNMDNVIEVSLNYSKPVPVTQVPLALNFTYSVTWVPTTVEFEDRFKKYLDYNFFEHQIHWFSIFNSCMMVIFLVGLVAMILMRILHKDFAVHGDEEGDDIDESGWKKVRAEVFRTPPHLVWFSSIYGTGMQLAFLCLFVIVIASMGTFYSRRGKILSTFVGVYAVTSFVGGYTSGSYYAENNGKNWIKTALLTSSLFPAICFGVVVVLNFMQVLYHVMGMHVSTQVLVGFIWLFVNVPLCFAGTLAGRALIPPTSGKGLVSPVPKVPEPKKWYLGGWAHILAGGILPFGSIFIEMYFIFTSLWHYKYYYVYGFLLLVYLILIIVTICVTIVSMYMLLNNEDPRWQWNSFMSAGSTALYVLMYSAYYFITKTDMSGFLQTIYYFGTVILLCSVIGLICGAVGFCGSKVFVKRIYAGHFD
ncbi:Endosomal membrane protein, EMP70 [Pelomyxa schiedti]|nr:Endosomal membrane protein, EMP70 [Pelomyxa schiedti]